MQIFEIFYILKNVKKAIPGFIPESAKKYITSNSLHHFPTGSHSSQQGLLQLLFGLLRLLQGLGAHFVTALLSLHTNTQINK